MARAGIGSRRGMETLIQEGRVTINGVTAGLGDRVGPSDRLMLDGRPLRIVPVELSKPRLVMYHKPVGELVTRDDPRGRPTVFETLRHALPERGDGRWIAIGRLDFNTSGLLLLTNSGDLAQRMMHPAGGMQREYAVRVLGELMPEHRRQLLAGVSLPDGPAHFDTLENAGGEGANRWYRVTLGEGRNREVRRLFEAVGLTVSRLMRVRFGPYELPRGLKQGRLIELDPDSVRQLEQGQAQPSIGQRPAPARTTRPLGAAACKPSQARQSSKPGRSGDSRRAANAGNPAKPGRAKPAPARRRG